MISDQDRFPSGPSDSFSSRIFVCLFRDKEGVFHAHFLAKKVGTVGFEPTTDFGLFDDAICEG